MYLADFEGRTLSTVIILSSIETPTSTVDTARPENLLSTNYFLLLAWGAYSPACYRTAALEPPHETGLQTEGAAGERNLAWRTEAIARSAVVCWLATKFLSLYAPLVCSPRVFAALPPPCGQPRQFPVLITRSRHGGRPGQRLRSLSPDSCPRHTHTTTTTHRRTSRHNTQHTHGTSCPAPPGSFRRDSSLLSPASSPRACARASSRRAAVRKRNGWAAESSVGSWLGRHRRRFDRKLDQPDWVRGLTRLL